MPTPLARRWLAGIEQINTRGIDGLDALVSNYAENCTFTDALQTLHGRETYREMNARLFSRVKSVRVEIDDILGRDDTFMSVGRMTVVAKVGPTVCFHGMAHARGNAEGLIVYQRDYLDMATSFLDAIPGIRSVYRRLMVSAFG